MIPIHNEKHQVKAAKIIVYAADFEGYYSFITPEAHNCVIRTLSFPKDAAELAQQLSHHALAYYDNLSRLP